LKKIGSVDSHRESGGRISASSRKDCWEHLGKFHSDDIATWHKEMADLAGIHYAGLRSEREF